MSQHCQQRFVGQSTIFGEKNTREIDDRVLENSPIKDQVKGDLLGLSGLPEDYSFTGHNRRPVGGRFIGSMHVRIIRILTEATRPYVHWLALTFEQHESI